MGYMLVSAVLVVTLGRLVAGPISGHLSDRHGARAFASGGLMLSAPAFAGLLLIPTDFGYTTFALLIFLSLVAALVSLLRGRRYVHDDDVRDEPAPRKAGRGTA